MLTPHQITKRADLMCEIRPALTKPAHKEADNGYQRQSHIRGKAMLNPVIWFYITLVVLVVMGAAVLA